MGSAKYLCTSMLPNNIQIIDPGEFCEELSRIVNELRLNHIDAVLYLCEKRSIEPE